MGHGHQQTAGHRWLHTHRRLRVELLRLVVPGNAFVTALGEAFSVLCAAFDVLLLLTKEVERHLRRAMS